MKQHRSFTCIVLCMGVIGTCVSVANAQLPVHAIEVGGDPVPGFPQGTIFTGGDIPAVSPSGIVLFDGFMQGPGLDSSNDEALWMYTGGQLELVAQEGDPVAGSAGGSSYDSFLQPSITDDGLVSFYGRFNDPAFSSPTEGIGLIDLHNGSVVTLGHGPMPGWPEDNWLAYYYLGLPLLGDGGHLTFVAWLQGPIVEPDSRVALWCYYANELWAVARGGFQAPGTEPGVQFSSAGFDYGYDGPVVNKNGQIAFSGRLQGPGVDTSNGAGYWLGPADAPQLILRQGDAAPAGGPAGVVAALHGISLNHAGQVALNFVIHDPEVTDSATDTIWRRDPDGSYTLVLAEGDPMPGQADDVSVGRLGATVINGQGDVAMIANLPESGQCLLAERDGQLVSTACTGDPAPATDDGVTFASIRSAFEFNVRGNLVFEAFVQGPGVTSENKHCTYATDSDRTLRLVAREGTPLEVAPGDVRVIHYAARLWDSSGGEDGRLRALAGNGTLAFRASFMDGTSGEFLVDLNVDTDGDGLPDDEDACPEENATGFDADGNGCIDRLADLPALVRSLPGIQPQLQRPLKAKAESALAAQERSNPTAALNALGAFLNLCEAQQGGKLNDDATEVLIAFVQNIMTNEFGVPQVLGRQAVSQPADRQVAGVRAAGRRQ